MMTTRWFTPLLHMVPAPAATSVLASLLLFSGSMAQPVPWFHPDSTMHYYDPVCVPFGITWDAASRAASYKGGNLATITSQDENDVVFSLINSDQFWCERLDRRLAGPWIGGIQPPGSPEPDGNWHWITGEPFVYSFWSPGEPNDCDGNESCVNFGEAYYGHRVPSWNDACSADCDITGFVIELSAASQTVGLFHIEEDTFEGYTLFAPLQSTTTYLIDNMGRLVHSWESDHTPGIVAYLLDDGLLLRTATLPEGGENPVFPGHGVGGRLQLIDWEGLVLWDYVYSSPEHLQHHDVEMLPNGNVLLLAWELKTAEQAIEAGRDPERIPDGVVWPEHIVEVEPVGAMGGNIVWEWHVWDHLIQDLDPSKDNYGVVADHPELIDVNFGHDEADWLHANTVNYNGELDQIVIGSAHNNEFYIIDHSTTTEEAAGHTGGVHAMGGDILYRWGNPRAHRAGTQGDQKLFYQHEPTWIPSGYPGAGNILVFDNGRDRPVQPFSAVLEIKTTADSTGGYPQPPSGTPHDPPGPTWTYSADPPRSLYSAILSNAQRQPNGNTLICSGATGRFVEVTPDGETVWEYVSPVMSQGALSQGETVPALDNPMGLEILANLMFRVYRYPPDYPGLAGHDLTPGYPIEEYSFDPAGIPVDVTDRLEAIVLHPNFPNPFPLSTTLCYELARPCFVELDVVDLAGRRVKTLVQGLGTAGRCFSVWDGTSDRGGKVPSGVYLYRLRSGGSTKTGRMLQIE